MKQDTQKTKVIFRKFKDGDVIALFPEEPGTNDPSTMWSYGRGGGGAASMDLTTVTTLATPAEYADLKAGLESVGYDLRVMKRMTRGDYQIRKKEINR